MNIQWNPCVIGHYGLRALLAAMVLAPLAAHADTFGWVCASSFYDVAICWSPNGVPISGDTANVGTVGGADTFLTIDPFTGAETAGSLNIDAAASTTVTFTIHGFGTPGFTSLTVDNDVVVGVAGTGTSALTVTGAGAISNVDGIIGEQAGATGTATVTGTGSQWTNTGSLYIGGNSGGAGGTGTLTVQTGGTIDVTNTLKLWGAGTLTLDGGTVRMDTLDVSLGTFNFNTGTLNFSSNFTAGSAGPLGATVSVLSDQTLVADANVALEPGASLTVNGGVVTGTRGTIGDVSGAASTATVTGTGSQWNSSSTLIVGEFGTGTLNVASGGVVSSALGIIGNQALSTGTATVTGAGSQWTSSGELFIGNDGNGTLNVEDRGVVSNGNTVAIGRSVGATGSATVTGTGSQLTSMDQLFVGDVGTGTLNISAGGVVSNTDGIIGRQTGSGTATVTGGGSQWNNSNDLIVGFDGNGMLTIGSGAIAAAGRFGSIGVNSGSVGSVTVTGIGSQWNNTLDTRVGMRGGGTLIISSGGVVSNLLDGLIGANLGGTGTTTVTGTGSQWSNTGNLFVGNEGSGTLNIEAGGVVSNVDALIGNDTNSAGTVTVTGLGSQWNIFTNEHEPAFWGDLFVGGAGTGTLNVEAGGVVSTILAATIGKEATSTGTATVSGPGSQWGVGVLTVGDAGTGTLNVEAGGEVSSFNAVVGAASTGTTTVTGPGSHWILMYELVVGDFGTATLNVEAGGVVSSTVAAIGNEANSTGTVTVTGPESQWTNLVSTAVGNGGNGTLNVEAGAVVSNDAGFIGKAAGSTGTATVTGAGSQWNNDSLYVGGSTSANGGAGILDVNPGGTVEVIGALTIWDAGTVNLNGGTLNAADVVMAGSTFNFNSGALNIGNDLRIGAGGALGNAFTLTQIHQVSVGGTTTLDPFSVLNLDGSTFSTGAIVNSGGFFNFTRGTLNLTNSALTIGAGGVLGASLQLNGNQLVNVTQQVTVESGAVLSLAGGTLTGGALLNNGHVDLNGLLSNLEVGSLVNNALITGGGRVSSVLDNAAAGEVRAGAGDNLRFTNAGNTNDGAINILGGTVEFTQDLTNNPGGAVSGRGTFIVDGGLDNNGNVAFSGGASDVFGDVNNLAGASILISGNATVTFWDDLVHNGTEIRVSSGSTAVFFGAVSGASPYTGSGDSFFEGDLNPGNSPGTLMIGGDATLGLSNTLVIELTELAQDRLDVDGELSLGGTLEVALVNGFAPAAGSAWVIALAGGGINGAFDEVLLPQMSGIAFALDYHPGALMLSAAAVPLPAGVWLLFSGLGMVAVRNRFMC